MNLLTLRESIELEQRLDVLPASEASDFTDFRDVDDGSQALAAGCVAEDRSLHVRGFHLAALHRHLAGGRDRGLGDVDALAVALGEAERDCDLVLGGGGLDDGELGAVESEAVLDVLDAEVEVDGAAPVDVSRVGLHYIASAVVLTE
jgi:hypothetical protein